jgi:hypothetical protein
MIISSKHVSKFSTRCSNCLWNEAQFTANNNYESCTKRGLAMNDYFAFCATCRTRFDEDMWRFFHVDPQLSKEPELLPEIITATNASDFFCYRPVICIIIWF